MNMLVTPPWQVSTEIHPLSHGFSMSVHPTNLQNYGDSSRMSPYVASPHAHKLKCVYAYIRMWSRMAGAVLQCAGYQAHRWRSCRPGCCWWYHKRCHAKETRCVCHGTIFKIRVEAPQPAPILLLLRMLLSALTALALTFG